MDRIGQVRNAAAPGAGGTRVAGGRFQVPSGGGTVAPAPAASAPAALDGLLSLQEQDADWHRDRPARRHAQAMIDGLAGLQRDLLAGDPDPASLHRLAALSRAVPHAADPRLAAVLHDVALRAAVELARPAVS